MVAKRASIPAFYESEHKLSDIKLPVILKNKILMAPGEWNGSIYEKEEIAKAYYNTDWTNKDNISLLLDHADNPNEAMRYWVGWVKNVRLKDGNLVGDLEIWDEPTAIKVVKAKAKCGISPKIIGYERDGKFVDFTFENFSIVTKPAVKKAYINLSEKNEGGLKMEKEKKKLEEEEKQEDEKQEDELSDEELLELTSLSEWTDFVAEMKKKYPKMTFKEIAKAFKARKEKLSEYENLSNEDIVKLIEELTEILRKRKYPYPYEYKYPKKKSEEEEGEDEESEAKKELEQLKKELSEVKKLLNEPDRKSKVSVDENKEELPKYKSGVHAMAEYLKAKFS